MSSEVRQDEEMVVLSRLLRGMARRVGELREFGVTAEGREEIARVKEEARGLRLTVAAQVRQLGVLETVRLSSDRLIGDLRRQVAAPVLPRRDDEVAAWIKSHRDQYPKDDTGWHDLDVLLDDYRLHADTGTPLAERVDEGGYGAAALSGEVQTDAG